MDDGGMMSKPARKPTVSTLLVRKPFFHSRKGVALQCFEISISNGTLANEPDLFGNVLLPEMKKGMKRKWGDDAELEVEGQMFSVKDIELHVNWVFFKNCNLVNCVLNKTVDLGAGVGNWDFMDCTFDSVRVDVEGEIPAEIPPELDVSVYLGNSGHRIVRFKDCVDNISSYYQNWTLPLDVTLNTAHGFIVSQTDIASMSYVFK